MEAILDRFLRYVAVDTQSDPDSDSQPSTAKQLDLLRLLRDELQALGISAELNEYGYVMASIPSNCGKDVPPIGFIAHVDTSPDAPGKDIHPQIIRKTASIPGTDNHHYRRYNPARSGRQGGSGRDNGCRAVHD